VWRALQLPAAASAAALEAAAPGPQLPALARRWDAVGRRLAALELGARDGSSSGCSSGYSGPGPSPSTSPSSSADAAGRPVKGGGGRGVVSIAARPAFRCVGHEGSVLGVRWAGQEEEGGEDGEGGRGSSCGGGGAGGKGGNRRLWRLVSTSDDRTARVWHVPIAGAR
jgi:hypothetical protein